MNTKRLSTGAALVLVVAWTNIAKAVDLNGDGVSDVWRMMHPTQAVPTEVANSPDSDGDGLTDWEERQLGFDPENANSVRSSSAGGDLEQFRRLVAGTQPDEQPSAETAARFLLQASLGPTEQQIEQVRQIGFAAWIDAQLASEPTRTEPYIEYLESRLDEDIDEPSFKFAYHKIQSAGRNVGYKNTSTAWMRAVLGGEDHLRQRVAWSLSQILVVSANGINILSEPMCNYYDLLIDGSFDRYEDVLLRVSLHPMMGKYLSHLGNQKADPKINRYPDENYAREIMQLFSIGLWELNADGSMKLDADGEPIATYSNDDIQTLARVFTGLWLEGEKFGRNNWDRYDVPMAMHDDRHDRDEKVALGGQIRLPAGQPPLDDIQQTVKALVAHPSTAPFISTRLINHLVTSNPSPAYIERVVRVWNETDGNLGAVVKAILLDPEARGPQYLVAAHCGRLKDPVLRCTTILRGFRAGAELGKRPTDYPGLQWWDPAPIDGLQQEPMQAPSVFNFFEAVYQKPGAIAEQNLRSPEFQILNDVTAATVPNYLWEGITQGFHHRRPRFPGAPLKCDFSIEEQLAGENLEALLDRCSLLLTAGTMRASTRQQLLTHLKKLDDPAEQARLAVFAAAVCPEGAILR